MSYKFVYTRDKGDGAYTAVDSIEMRVDDDSTIAQMCEAFEQFLRASGYSFTGSLEIVEPDQCITEAANEEE